MLLSKRFSLFALFVMMAFIALFLALVAALLDHQKLVTTIDANRDLVKSQHQKLFQRIETSAAELADARKAAMLLVRLGGSEKNSAVFSFLQTMESSSLACSVSNLPDSDRMALFVYHLPNEQAGESSRPVFERQSVQVLADQDSLLVVDVIMHTGYRTESRSTDQPWETCYDYADGTQIRYRILPTGFDLIQE